MSTDIITVWFVRCALGGGLLLLIVSACMSRTQQPARRQRLGEWGIVAALVLAVLSLGPSWISIHVSLDMADSTGVDAEMLSEDPLPPTSLLDLESILENPIEPKPVEETASFVKPSMRNFDIESVPVQPLNEAPGRPADRLRSKETWKSDVVTLLYAQLQSPWIAVWGRRLLVVYCIGVAALLIRLGLGYWVLRRFLQTATPAPWPAQQLFQAMTEGFHPRPRLLVSRNLEVPVSCGLLVPTVVVTSELCQPGAFAKLRWVFAHELTHLRRNDAWTCLFLGLGQALYFYLPWFWWLRRQVHLCQEYLADAAAVDQADQAVDYAQFLLSLRHAAVIPARATGVSGNSSDLFRRIAMLLKESSPLETVCPRRWSLAAASSLLAFAVLASGFGLSLAPTASAAEQKEVKVFKYPTDSEKSDGDKKVERIEVTVVADPKKDGEDKKSFEEALRKALKDLPREATVDQIQKAVMEVLDKHHGAIIKQQIQAKIAGKGVELPQEKLQIQRLAKVMQAHRSGIAPKQLGIQGSAPSKVVVDQLDLPKGQGLIIDEVLPNSAAEKAGLKVNDILLEVNGKSAPSDLRELAKMLENTKEDATISVVILRKGKKETIKDIKLQSVSGDVLRLTPQVKILNAMPKTDLVIPKIELGGAASGKNVTRTVQINNDRYSAKHQEGSLTITLTGTMNEGKLKITEIKIEDGSDTDKYESIDKVPERYRAKVKDLADTSDKGKIKVEIKAP